MLFLQCSFCNNVLINHSCLTYFTVYPGDPPGQNSSAGVGDEGLGRRFGDYWPEAEKSKYQKQEEEAAHHAAKKAEWFRKQQVQNEEAKKALHKSNPEQQRQQEAVNSERERQARMQWELQQAQDRCEVAQAAEQRQQEAVKAERERQARMQWELQQEQARHEEAQAADWERMRQERLQRNAAEMLAKSMDGKRESDRVSVETASLNDMSLEDGPLNYVPGASEGFKKVNVNGKEIPAKFAKVTPEDPEGSQAQNPIPTAGKTATPASQRKQAPSAMVVSHPFTVPESINVDYDQDYMERPFTTRDEEKSVTFMTSPLSQGTFYTTNSNVVEGSFKAAPVQQSSKSVASRQSPSRRSGKSVASRQSASRKSVKSASARQSSNSVASRQSRVPSVSDSSNSIASRGSRTREERARAREEMKAKREGLEKKDSSDSSL